MRLSIKYKFTYVFIIIFFISFILSVSYMKNTISKNNENMISEKMYDIMLNSTRYVKQFFLTNDIEPNSYTFKDHTKEIGDILSEKIRCDTQVYSTEGSFLYNSNLKNGILVLGKDIKNKNKDIELAKKNMAATTTITQNSKMYVNLSFPVYINRNLIGIIRITKDYSDLYLAGIKMTNALTIFFAFLFLAVSIASFFISNHITRPLLSLRKSLDEVANGNYNTSICIKNNDEIGDFAEDFCTMRDKIKNQIKTIQDDKEKILRAEKHRQEFFNNVTHELKTPLTSISGYAQILQEENFSEDEMYIRAVERIRNESNRLHSMVVELIDVSKNNTKNISLEEINISPLIIETCRDMSLKSERYNIKIKTFIEKNIFVCGNKNYIQELMINVLDNAIKYGESNTDITVKSHCQDQFAILEILNIGKGIPQNKIDKVFQPFYKINNVKEKGSCGLGLFICKDIVDRHNGEIYIESIENEFTKIIIKIPLIGYNLVTISC